MAPMAQQYLVYAILFGVFLVGVLVVWRLSKKRRAPAPPVEEQPGKPKLERVPLELVREKEEKKPPEEKPTDLKEGLSKTRGGFIARIGGLLGKKQIDAALVDQL